MLQVKEPKTRQEVTDLLHEILGLFVRLPRRMMDIDLSSDEPGMPFSECKPSALIEVMVLSSYIAVKDEDDELLEYLTNYIRRVGPRVRGKTSDDSWDDIIEGGDAQH